jgi:hypothetical protein
VEDPQEAVAVYKTESSAEAHFVKNMLIEEGVEAVVADEVALPTLITPSEVLVKRADEARARAIVEEYDDEKIRRAEREDWKCAVCGATVIGAFDICDACGADRPDSPGE